MRIHILSYIGAEDDIIESFVRHALRYADGMTIVSTVAGTTRNMLQQLQQEGLPLDIICHEPAFHDQHLVLTKLLHQQRKKADWFVLLDADEFVTGDIRAALEQSESVFRSLVWKTYVPTKDDGAEPDILKRIRHRRSVEVPQFTKIVIPSVAIWWHTHIGRGNHIVSTFTLPYQWSWHWGKPLQDVSIAHFPVRTAEQMAHKIERSWPAVARNPQRLSDEAFHWAAMHHQYAGKPLSSQDLTDIALRYSAPADAPLPDIVEDPVI